MPRHVEAIHRDAKHSLNELGQIFDKKKLEERQELARLVAKYAYEQLHQWEPKTDKERAEKAIAHGMVAEAIARLGGSTAGSGFAAGAINEAVVSKFEKEARKHPEAAQWASLALGAMVNGALGKPVQSGGAVAQYGTKWNATGTMMNLPGTYLVDMFGQWYQVGPMGEHIYVEGQADAIPDGTVFVMQESQKGSQSVGYEYRFNKSDGSATYLPEPKFLVDATNPYGIGGSLKIEFDTSRKMNYVDSGLESKPITTTNNNIEPSSFNYWESVAMNTFTTEANMPLDLLERQKFGGMVLKGVNRLGGFMGIGLVGNDIRRDLQQYSGSDLGTMLFSDMVPVGGAFYRVWAGGYLGGLLGPVGGAIGATVGGIIGGVAGDKGKSIIREKVEKK